MSWATRGYFFADLKEDASLRLLVAILREKLLEAVRGQGMSYSVQVSAPSSSAFDYGYLSATATMPAGKAEVFYDAVGKIIADLKAGEISADAFERARAPTLKDFSQSVETNDYWLGLLSSGWEIEPRFDRARHYQQALESVTVADVAAVARQYLTDERLIKISAGF